MQLSAAFPTSLATPDHVRIAEELGYGRAWLYDTPQQSPDVWMILALAAERTSTIGLGPGVLVPTLRHPMVNAAGAAALAELAPGRAAVAFGTGFTGRRAMGQPKPIPWSYMTRYITAFRGLLAGEVVEWEGSVMAMLHSADSARLPVELPIYIGALGPKGLDVVRELADGLFVSTGLDGLDAFDHVACLAWGTVLAEGEAPTADRVRAAAGPGVAQAFHATYEIAGADATADLPGGREWLDVIEATPESERHLAVHRRHCLELNVADAAAWAGGADSLTELVTLTGTADSIRDRVRQLADRGVTELVYQPSGDIPTELNTFATAMQEPTALP